MNILLVGCGNFGRRWLDAISLSSLVTHIDVVDPKYSAQNHEYPFANFYNSLKGLLIQHHYNLIINCVNAKERSSVIQECSELGITSDTLVLEKVLAQSLYDLQTLASLSISNRTYVNYNMRYQNIISQIESPKLFSVDLGLFDLASNIFHYIDLAENILSSQLLNIDLTNLSLNWCESKKRPRFKTVTGMVRAVLSNGTEIVLQSVGSLQPCIAITTESGDIYEINENLSTVKVRNSFHTLQVASSQQWNHFSKFSTLIVDDLLTQQSKLPRLEHVLNHTRIIMEALLIHYIQSIDYPVSAPNLSDNSFLKFNLPIT